MRADWNSKYTKEFTDEEWNKVRAEAESKLAVINNMNNQLKKDTATAKDYTNGLTKAADATFEKLVNDAKKRLGK